MQFQANFVGVWLRNDFCELSFPEIPEISRKRRKAEFRAICTDFATQHKPMNPNTTKREEEHKIRITRIIMPLVTPWHTTMSNF